MAVADLPRIVDALAAEFSLERFPHSINVSSDGSDLRVQIQADPRHASFVERATERRILG
jgi:hypothetical protein